MTNLPPPPPPGAGDDHTDGWAAPTPGTGHSVRPPSAEPGTGPRSQPTGRQQVIEARMAALRVPARWEELRDQRARGERPPTRGLVLVGLALSALALVAGGVLLARGAGGAEARIDARVAVGESGTVELRAGEYDLAVEGRRLLRSGTGRQSTLTTAVAFEPPEVTLTGPSGGLPLERAVGERGGSGDRQRVLVARVELPTDGTYTLTVGEWGELVPDIRAVVIGETPLLVQRNVWTGIVMLAIGFAGVVITLVSMAVGTLVARRRR